MSNGNGIQLVYVINDNDDHEYDHWSLEDFKKYNQMQKEAEGISDKIVAGFCIGIAVIIAGIFLLAAIH